MVAAGRRIGTGGRVGIAVLGLGLVAAGLLVAAELSAVLDIEVGGLPCVPADPTLAEECSPSGASRHTWALGLLGLLAVVMAWGAGIGRSRPAAVGLLAAGAAVLGIVLIADLPQINDTGQIGIAFEDAAAMPASGFWLSLAGGAVAVAAGVLALLTRR